MHRCDWCKIMLVDQRQNVISRQLTLPWLLITLPLPGRWVLARIHPPITSVYNEWVCGLFTRQHRLTLSLVDKSSSSSSGRESRARRTIEQILIFHTYSSRSSVWAQASVVDTVPARHVSTQCPASTNVQPISRRHLCKWKRSNHVYSRMLYI